MFFPLDDLVTPTNTVRSSPESPLSPTPLHRLCSLFYLDLFNTMTPKVIIKVLLHFYATKTLLPRHLVQTTGGSSRTGKSSAHCHCEDTWLQSIYNNESLA